MSKVHDKYRPVDATPATTTAPWIVILGSLSVVAVGVLWGASDLRSWVSAEEELPFQEAWLTAASTVEGVADASGISAARSAVDAWVAPLQDTAPVLARPAPPVEPLAALGTDTDSEDTDAVDTDAPPGARWVGPDDPRFGRVQRVALIGASSIQYYLGVELERRLEADFSGVQVHRLGKLGTGLVRQDVFDWPAAVGTILQTHSPQVVLIQLGGNDAQPITVDGRRVPFGQDGWDAAYAERLDALIAQIRAAGATPIFLGMPVMRDEGFSARMERLNTVTREAAARGGARYMPTWDLVSNADGTYQAEVAHDGRRGRMRLQDGVHYSRLGAQYLADRLVTRLEREVRLVRADDTGVHVGLRTPGGHPAHAWVPRQVPPEGLPPILLQVPVEADPAWLDAAQRAIPAQLATRAAVVVALPAEDGLVQAQGEDAALTLTPAGQAWLEQALPVAPSDAPLPVHRVGLDGLGTLPEG